MIIYSFFFIIFSLSPSTKSRGAFLVENAGLEPVTSCMSSKRSNLLS